MRNVVLLLIAVLGLYSFSGSKEERNAFIRKSIEERAKSVGMEAWDIRLVRVERISERDYERYIVRGCMGAIAGKATIMPGKRATEEETKKWEAKFEEKLSKLSDEKNYGYFVKVKCRFKNQYRKSDALSTTHFVISEKAGTEVATKQ